MTIALVGAGCIPRGLVTFTQPCTGCPVCGPTVFDR